MIVKYKQHCRFCSFSFAHNLSGQKVTETSVIELLRLVYLKFRHVDINASFSARTVQLAKTTAITRLLTYATTFSGWHLMSHNSNVPYYKTKNFNELTCSKTSSSYRVGRNGHLI